MFIKRTSLQCRSEKKLKITVGLIRKISMFNTYLNPYEVIEELKKGSKIHGTFSKYELVKEV